MQGSRDVLLDWWAKVIKRRLDQELVARQLAPTRSQAENYIRLGDVKLNGSVTLKPGTMVDDESQITISDKDQYVSRAGLKLASVANTLSLTFKDKIMLDVGSSTGGFTDYALRHGAKKVFAVDVGTNQLHQSLHGDPRIELHEQTDIRDFKTNQRLDIVVIDVSFISLQEILPSIASLCHPTTQIVAMVKPQFEASVQSVKHKGVIKNDKMRREILKDFEVWATAHKFVIQLKSDSHVAGTKGNIERFYVLKRAR